VDALAGVIPDVRRIHHGLHSFNGSPAGGQSKADRIGTAFLLLYAMGMGFINSRGRKCRFFFAAGMEKPGRGWLPLPG
jgi:hypothetical protein